MLGKVFGRGIQSVSGIAESIRKKKDAKELMSKAKLMQKNHVETDISTNHLAQLKVNDEGTRLALENINQSAQAAIDNASSAGIRGMGMIGKIQQNTNQAIAQQAAGLSEKQSQIDVAAAKEQANIDLRVDARSQAKLSRADAMLERGQAMRSQAAAEFGTATKNLGSAVDEFIDPTSKLGSITNNALDFTEHIN